MILILGPIKKDLGPFFEKSKWILREILKQPVDNCMLICEELNTGVKVIFNEKDFSHYVDTDALLPIDYETEKQPKN